MRAFAVGTASLALLAVGCGEANEDLDPTPEDQSGAPSGEFEPEDIDRAESAERLVELYCTGGSTSEAQQVGCLSHVTVDVVCEQNTAAQSAAVEEYIAETGDEAICD